MRSKWKCLYVVVVIIILFNFSSVAMASLGNRPLKMNVQGDDVRELQERLVLFGYDVEVDGVFGSKTRIAVSLFQRDNGLREDGIAGPETVALLTSVASYFEYTVQRGDSLYALAKQYNTEVKDIINLNNLKHSVIYVGQELKIPLSAGSFNRTYTVQRGDSLYSISKKFGTPMDVLIAANDLKNPNLLKVGQELIIPMNIGSRDGSVSRWNILSSLIWPASGRISSGFGWRDHPIYSYRQFHEGIDIAVSTGTPVKAAASGTVIDAGYMGGFGYGVVIYHGDGVTTWYGHNSRLLVKKGDTVVQGQVIALSGSTGVSTGPHLDFRIKIDDEAVNPRIYLP
jgi:murein DD-endopeptidase MepM/ murein hydrolase activator NlpD